MKFLVISMLLASAALAQESPPGGASGLVFLRGTDTLSIERYLRTRDSVVGALTVPAQDVRTTYVFLVAADGSVPRIDLAVTKPSDASGAVLQRVRAVFAGDSVALISAGQSMQRPAPRGAIPYLNLSGVFIEQVLMRAKAIGGASPDVQLFTMAGAGTPVASVRWLGADSATVLLGGVEIRARVATNGALLGGVVPSQGVRIVRATVPLPAGPTAPARDVAPPDYSAPKGAPYTAENVSVRNGTAGIAIAGTLTTPRHAAGERVPAVVMITGSGPEDRDEATPAIPGYRPFRQIADTLSRRGIAVLRLDDRGVGGTPAGPPGPTSADFADDIRSALAYLRTRPDVDPARLGLVGHSEGGMIAPMIAATDSSLHAMVLIAPPARTGREVSDEQVRAAFLHAGLSGSALDSAIHANAGIRDAQVAQVPWLAYWFAYDPIPTAQRVRTPVLIVQGAKDTQIDPAQAEELAAAFRAGGDRDVTVRLMPETNHLLVHDPNGSFSDYSKLASLSVTPEVLGAIADWLTTRMGVRPR